MAFERARRKVVSVIVHRCIYLFAALLLLFVMVPFLQFDPPTGKFLPWP